MIDDDILKGPVVFGLRAPGPHPHHREDAGRRQGMESHRRRDRMGNSDSEASLRMVYRSEAKRGEQVKDKTYILLRETIIDAAAFMQEFGVYPSPTAAKADIQTRKETGKFDLVLRIESFTARTEQMVMFDAPDAKPRKKRGPNKPKSAEAAAINEANQKLAEVPSGLGLSIPDPKPLSEAQIEELGRQFSDEMDLENDPGAAPHEIERSEPIVCEAGAEPGTWSVDIVAQLYSDGRWGYCRTAGLSGAELSGEVTERFDTKSESVGHALLGIRRWLLDLPAKLKRGDKGAHVKALEDLLAEVAGRVMESGAA